MLMDRRGEEEMESGIYLARWLIFRARSTLRTFSKSSAVLPASQDPRALRLTCLPASAETEKDMPFVSHGSTRVAEESVRGVGPVRCFSALRFPDYRPASISERGMQWELSRGGGVWIGEKLASGLSMRAGG